MPRPGDRTRQVGKLAQQGTQGDASTGSRGMVQRQADRALDQTLGFHEAVRAGEIKGFPGQDLDLEIWQAAWPYGRRAWLEQASGHQKPVEGWPMPAGKSSVKHDRGEHGWAMKVRTSGKSGVGDGLLGRIREASG